MNKSHNNLEWSLYMFSGLVYGPKLGLIEARSHLPSCLRAESAAPMCRLEDR